MRGKRGVLAALVMLTGRVAVGSQRMALHSRRNIARGDLVSLGMRVRWSSRSPSRFVLFALAMAARAEPLPVPDRAAGPARMASRIQAASACLPGAQDA